MAAHGFLSLEFWIAYLVLLVVTGAAVPVTIAFLGAIAISHFVRTRYTEKEEPIPSKSAIVITGSSTGIGADAALSFSKEGFTVFAILRKQSDAEALLSKVDPSARDRLVPILCDITVKEQVQRARDDVASELTKRGLYLHALINNAGLGNSGPLELLTLESLRRQFEVNVFAQVAVTQAFLSLLRLPAPSTQTLSRRIIFTSSVVGHITFPTYGPYASSKQALEGLVDALRNEVKPWNIDVVSIAPGRIASNFSSTNNSNIQANIDQAKQQGGGEFPVPPDVLSVYENMQAKFLKKIAGAKYQTTEVTTNAFRLALLAKRPPTRAPAGRDAAVLVPFAVNIPDRFRDFLFGV